MKRYLVMKKYTGTKIINAVLMTRLEYNNFRRWELPSDENGADEGYLVEYTDCGQVNTTQHDWSPKDVFEKAYRETDGLSFGLAIEAMRKGLKVARKGWNGRGIFISLQVPDKNSKMTSPYIYIDTTGLYNANPHAPKGLVPWLASQTDMLADDWVIVE